jgi:hypothetical protein
MKQNLSDPVIDEIREVRHRISARFDHDSTRLVAHYIELQKEHQHRLIESGKRAERTNQSAAQPGAPADRPKAAGR